MCEFNPCACAPTLCLWEFNPWACAPILWTWLFKPCAWAGIPDWAEVKVTLAAPPVVLKL